LLAKQLFLEVFFFFLYCPLDIPIKEISFSFSIYKRMVGNMKPINVIGRSYIYLNMAGKFDRIELICCRTVGSAAKDDDFDF
jgi:hypothetical protein